MTKSAKETATGPPTITPLNGERRRRTEAAFGERIRAGKYPIQSLDDLLRDATPTGGNEHLCCAERWAMRLSRKGRKAMQGGLVNPR